MAFEKWQFEAQEMKRQERELRGAIQRMLNRKVSMAWEQWQAWYSQRMEERRKLAQALGRMMHRQLAMAMNRWFAWYDDLMDQRRRLAGAVIRMQNRQLSMAWEQWQAFYQWAIAPPAEEPYPELKKAPPTNLHPVKTYQLGPESRARVRKAISHCTTMEEALNIRTHIRYAMLKQSKDPHWTKNPCGARDREQLGFGPVGFS